MQGGKREGGSLWVLPLFLRSAVLTNGIFLFRGTVIFYENVDFCGGIMYNKIGMRVKGVLWEKGAFFRCRIPNCIGR